LHANCTPTLTGGTGPATCRGAVHQRPPRSCSGRSRTVADCGGRWRALLESVLGATPREFESPILRYADLQQHRPRQLRLGHFALAWSQLVVSIRGPGGAIAVISRSHCAWSRRCRTGLNGGTHAAEACGRKTVGSLPGRSKCSRIVTTEGARSAVMRRRRLGVGYGAHRPDRGDMRCLNAHLAELVTGHGLQPRYHYGNESGIGPGLILDAPGDDPLAVQANVSEGSLRLATSFRMCVTGVHFGAPQGRGG
jgi:hypothetical protein